MTVMTWGEALTASIAAVALSFFLARVGVPPKKKRIRRQYGVPYANNLCDLAARARRKFAPFRAGKTVRQ